MPKKIVNKKQVHKNKRINKFAFGIVLIATVVILVAAFFQKSNSEKISTLDGIVTKKSPTIADAGSTIYVDNIPIETSRSGLRSDANGYPNLYKDTSSIKKGDHVVVHYTYNRYDQASIECDSCYIKKVAD